MTAVCGHARRVSGYWEAGREARARSPSARQPLVLAGARDDRRHPERHQKSRSQTALELRTKRSSQAQLGPKAQHFGVSAQPPRHDLVFATTRTKSPTVGVIKNSSIDGSAGLTCRTDVAFERHLLFLPSTINDGKESFGMFHHPDLFADGEVIRVQCSMRGLVQRLSPAILPSTIRPDAATRPDRGLDDDLRVAGGVSCRHQPEQAQSENNEP